MSDTFSHASLTRHDLFVIVHEQVDANLVVLNLSQQTDSADLLGGFQPVEPRHALLPLLDHFQVTFVKLSLSGMLSFTIILMHGMHASWDGRVQT